MVRFCIHVCAVGLIIIIINLLKGCHYLVWYSQIGKKKQWHVIPSRCSNFKVWEGRTSCDAFCCLHWGVKENKSLAKIKCCCHSWHSADIESLKITSKTAHDSSPGAPRCENAAHWRWAIQLPSSVDSVAIAAMLSACEFHGPICEIENITYGPHKAVAEVSNHNEPIGRGSGTQLVGKSMDFTFNCFVLNWQTD